MHSWIFGELEAFCEEPNPLLSFHDSSLLFHDVAFSVKKNATRDFHVD
jgi:hypothetical protein